MSSGVPCKGVLRTALWASGRGAAGPVSGAALGHPSTHCHSQVAAGGDRELPDLTRCWTE